MIFVALISAFATAALPFAHTQTIDYNSSHVVSLKGCLNFQTVIHILPGERIEVIAIGNSFDWQVTPNQRGDLISIKATTASGISNLTIVTSKSSYNFALETASETACAAGEVIYEVRFRQAAEYFKPENLAVHRPPNRRPDAPH